jgi:hypothetical protein
MAHVPGTVDEFLQRKQEEIERENRRWVEAESAKPIWEEIPELMQGVPQEEWDRLPRDGAVNLDHYLYGAPKRQE